VGTPLLGGSRVGAPHHTSCIATTDRNHVVREDVRLTHRPQRPSQRNRLPSTHHHPQSTLKAIHCIISGWVQGVLRTHLSSEPNGQESAVSQRLYALHNIPPTMAPLYNIGVGWVQGGPAGVQRAQRRLPLCPSPGWAPGKAASAHPESVDDSGARLGDVGSTASTLLPSTPRRRPGWPRGTWGTAGGAGGRWTEGASAGSDTAMAAQACGSVPPSAHA
jgi:hypothetical protein